MKRRYAVFSDVHSNLTAFCAVLKEMEADGPYDKYFCPGDVVGYGTNPNECIMLAEKIRAKTVRGNHDRAVLTGDTGGFNAYAREAALYNRSLLTEESRRFLEKLSPEPYVDEEIAMVHGSFGGDFEDTYIFEGPEAALAMYEIPATAKIGIVGHTHIPMYGVGVCDPLNPDPPEIKFFWNPKPKKYAIKVVSGQQKILFNPGSVGQPRNGDPRACWAIVEIYEGKVTLDFRRTEYDIKKTQERMRRVKLPQPLIDRLAVGR